MTKRGKDFLERVVRAISYVSGTSMIGVSIALISDSYESILASPSWWLNRGLNELYIMTVLFIGGVGILIALKIAEKKQRNT